MRAPIRSTVSMVTLLCLAAPAAQAGDTARYQVRF
jgi:hypothetical protein